MKKHASFAVIIRAAGLTGLLAAVAVPLQAQIEVVSGGNVGVGTSSPGNKFTVEGTGDVAAVGSSTKKFYFAPDTNGVGLFTGAGKTGNGLYADVTNNALVVSTNSTERFRIDSSGNFGIGTNSPIGKFDIRKDGTYNDLNTSALNLTTVSSPTSQMRMGFDLAVDGAYIQSVRNGVAVKSLFLNAQGGNVGVGTTSPQAPLHVKSSVGPTSGGQSVLVLEANPAGTNAGPRLDFSDGATVLAKIREVYDSGQGALAFHTYYLGDGERMRITALGNVGIGTTSPSQKLEVAGSVRATSFISNSTTYADFVFEPGYKLPSLSEVEAHIKQLGHLPGIPSEAEAKEHGIDLAAMQVKLLQKIEELTLHQIAQEKQIATQAVELAELKARK